MPGRRSSRGEETALSSKSTPHASRRLLVLAAGTAIGVLLPAGVAAAGTDVTSQSYVQAALRAQAQHKKLSQQQKAAIAINFARKHLGDGYKMGAHGPHRWDCSALVGGAWKAAGVKLPRTTTAIYKAHLKHVAWAKLQPGDIMEFYGRSHVGIYVGHGYMIHASSGKGKVVKVKLVYPGYSFKNYFNGAVRPGT